MPADVTFKRVPGVGSGAWTQLALLYYSLEAMGKLDTLHIKAFDAMHKDNVNLANQKIARSVARQERHRPGAVRGRGEILRVQSKLSRAQQLMGSYKVDGVPMVIVNGKYVTSTGHAGGPDRVDPRARAADRHGPQGHGHDRRGSRGREARRRRSNDSNGGSLAQGVRPRVSGIAFR